MRLHKKCIAAIMRMIVQEGNVFAETACDDCVYWAEYVNPWRGQVSEDAARQEAS